MLRNKRRLLLPALLCAATLTGGCGREKAAETVFDIENSLVQETVEFQTTSVTKGVYRDELTFSGTVVYLNSTTLSFEEVPAVFGGFLVEEGDYVEAGTVLAECEVLLSEQEVEEKRTQRDMLLQNLSLTTDCLTQEIEALKEQEALLTGAEQTLCRLTREKKENELAAYRAEEEGKLQVLENQIAVWEGEKNANRIVAPIDGYIDKLAYVKAGDEITDDRWMIRMHAEDEAYLQVSDRKEALNCLMKVTIQAGKNGEESYPAVVVQADAVLEDAVKTGKAYILPLDSSVSLKELVNPVVKAEKPVLEDALMVSRNAVYTSKGKKYVLLYEDGVMKKRYVTVGPNNSSVICILDGVSEGDLLVIQ